MLNKGAVSCFRRKRNIVISIEDFRRACEIISDAFNQMRLEQIQFEDSTEAVVEFTAATALIAGGIEGAVAIGKKINVRIQECVEDQLSKNPTIH